VQRSDWRGVSSLNFAGGSGRRFLSFQLPQPQEDKVAAFTFRMGAGFAGEANRSHPFTIEPALNDATNPATFYGEAVMFNGSANDVRTTAAGDSATTYIAGVVVRPFPQQAPTAPQNYGGTGTVASPFGSAGTPPSGAPIDILKSGYIMVPCVGTPNKGGQVYVWYGATGGGHTHGGFEAASGASTMALELDGRVFFNGPPDANGLVELAFNV
jgi:hypothetical protein